LAGALPYLYGWDACLPEGEGSATSGDLLSELCAYPGPVIAAGERRWHAAGLERERPMVWVEFGVASYGQRKRMWEYWAGPGTAVPVSVRGENKLTAKATKGAGWDLAGLA